MKCQDMTGIYTQCFPNEAQDSKIARGKTEKKQGKGDLLADDGEQICDNKKEGYMRV